MKKITLRAVSSILALSLLLASSLATVGASGFSLFEHQIEQSFEERQDFDCFGSCDQSTEKYEYLRSYLTEQFSACNSSISLAGKNVYHSDFDEFSDFISDEFPDMFHVGKITYYYNAGTDLFTKMTVEYIYSASEFKEKQAQLKTVVAWLTRDLDSASDLEKIVIIHDRLAVWSEYDYANYVAGSIPRKSYTMAGTLLDHVGVCQGYALSYCYLLRQLGVECRVESSDQMGHAWNIVTLNGNEYHVDVTWDDPSQNNYGQAKHENLLLSSEGINTSHGEECTDIDMSQTDTTYEGYYWEDSLAEFQLIDGDFYYVDSANRNICRRSGTTSMEICSLSDYWWGYCISGMCSFCYLSYDEDRLFVSTPSSICSVNLTTGELTPVYTPTLESGYKIFGFKAYDGVFYMEYLTSPRNTGFSDDCRYEYAYINYFTLSYNANGGSGAPASQSVKEGTAAAISSTEPVRAGYNFLGWASSAAADSAEYTGGSSVTIYSDKTLYAVWDAKSYTVSFNANGGTCSASPISVYYGSTYGTLPSATKTDYNFDGWYTSASGGSEVTASSTVNVSANHTLYAHWDGKPLTITLDCNGGVSDDNTVSTKCGALTGADLPTPTKEGYIFTGWLLNGKRVESDDVIEASGSVSLTARWAIKPTVIIKNYVACREDEDYRSSFLFTARVTNLPDGAVIKWYNGKTLLDTGTTCEVEEARSSFTVTAVIEDEDGIEYARSETEKVVINGGLWQMIMAFFRSLFTALPYIEQ